ncbi:MAG: glucoamylase family protein [Arenicellales bacterium]
MLDQFLSDDPPLRAELFSADQMEQHGKRLAATHALSSRRGKDQLLIRLAENERVLVEVFTLLTATVTARQRITPATKWLLDNFYLIEEEIRTARRHLPVGYSGELPCLRNGPSAGLARVYDIALETVAHGDGQIDLESLQCFVAAYQTIAPLTLGELWAIPIMLRLAVIENLRRVAGRIAVARADRDLAGTWTDRMIGMAEKDPKSLVLVIADMARSNPPMSFPFVAEAARRLRGLGPALAFPLSWIEQRLSESGMTIEKVVQAENREQAADQVSISNCIGGLRFLRAMDWRDFVEAQSAVEQALRDDPGEAYGQMDFATRDRYRHVIERIARGTRVSEADVARRVVAMAHTAAASHGRDHRRAHVGFYLIGQGLPAFERALAAPLSAATILRRTAGRFPLFLYLGGIALITLWLTASLLAYARADGAGDGVLVLVCGLALLSTSQLAVALVNWFVMLLVSPAVFPRMDFSRGIPRTSRTLVVVPTMLTGAENIESLVEALEVRFLGNQDPNLHFGLLTDFRDARAETLPEDERLLRLAEMRIEALNDKYPGSGRFFLFHRPRRWNPQERVWMGYERKRGKLGDLNALLRGGDGASFARIIGDRRALDEVKYVITLDTDTQLPRDAARQLVGAMAHPLNRAHYDARRQCVTAGYGILQPRVSASLPGMNRSRYARLFGGEAGMDPYTRAVSDVYQDAFDEGSFIGKGIYDIDAFEQALGERFPENRILSHDLLEGCYARAGLVSDVELIEDFPHRYHEDVDRRHRWMRGDWQLVPWLMPGVPGAQARRRQANPLSALSRWKLLDNLRRSLVPAALALLLLLGWIVMTSAWLWTVAVIVILLVPSLVTSLLTVLQKPTDALTSQHLASALRSSLRRFSQVTFSLACLPYEAFFSLDAVVRTLGRLWLTHRHLLEWNPSGEKDRRDRTSLAGSFRTMWIAPTSAVSTAFVLLGSRPAVLAVAAPILLLWFTSPVIAWWISRPRAPRAVKLTAEQISFLRMLARKTWGFFETFANSESHWLPPDNVQEYPGPAIAYRTSPTNMGLSLLANLSAYDFGYLPAGALLERSANALETMDALTRYRGHFYNWYDTQSLKPLHPKYVSTVDSGNLAGHLLTLRPGLLALVDDPIFSARCFDGLHDTLRILLRDEAVAGSPALLAFQRELESISRAAPTSPTAARVCIDRLTTLAAQIPAGPDDDHDSGARALARQCQQALDELTELAPWVLLGEAPSTLRNPPAIAAIPTLRELAGWDVTLLPGIDTRLTQDAAPVERRWLTEFRAAITDASRRARERLAMIAHLARKAGELARMEYDFLYDPARHLLAIGYNVDDDRRDPGYYDLLASEARLGTFVAIAQGELPQESWFALGRLLITIGGAPTLLSWSGSMFEYLMPLLVMPTYDGTLLDQTCHAAVQRQIEYGSLRGVPWGMSESGYNTLDANLNYQYRAFGVPGLGLKRGLAEDLVVAPYASMLALMVAPEAACENLRRLVSDGLEGRFGLFEAIDYTASRVPQGRTGAVVRSFMAHHLGMSLLSLAYALLDRPMQRRFRSDPLFQATDLLLQERIPEVTVFYAHKADLSVAERMTADSAVAPIRVFDSPDTSKPEVQLLSNGRYHVMVTNAGGGYSRWKDLAVTRWHEDTTRDNWGAFCYLRDVASGEYWSSAYQPTLKVPQHYEAIFSEGRAEFRRHDRGFDTHTEIAVSPEDDIELRRVRLTNRSGTRRTVEATSYAEVVLAPAAADALHPAFSNLFVQTEIDAARRAILCTRRARSRDEQVPWMLHLMTAHDADIDEISYETDRAQFVGRGNTVAAPAALNKAASQPDDRARSSALSGSAGSVLDPIVAIRYRITLEPDQTVTLDMISGVADTREAGLRLIDKYQDRRLADRVFELAWTHSQVVLQQLNATEADAQVYASLASSVLYANPSLRADASVFARNRRGQSGLWGYAISGDLPIVLLQIGDIANLDLARQLVQAHAYWSLKGLAVDLVIWNEDRAGYRQLLQEQIIGMVAAGDNTPSMNRRGGIFVRPAVQISDEDRVLLRSVARVILSDRRGTLVEQLNRRGPTPVTSAVSGERQGTLARLLPFVPTLPRATGRIAVAKPPPRELILFNGLGGFTPDGREYVTTLAPGQTTPAPWANVIANAHFGSVISESGQAYTWGENAHEFRLTPWHNDPVSDDSGEALYLRDEESGYFWSPTPLPSRGSGYYVSRHGFGYSVFEHDEAGIRSTLTVYVSVDAAIKFSVLKVHNASGRTRRLSATGYVEWVLGDLRSRWARYVTTEADPHSGALIARNAYNTEFVDRVAFFHVDDEARTTSSDRGEFLGRNGTHRRPAALQRARLSDRVGTAADPCAAIQVGFELVDGEEREIVFRLGVARDTDAATELAHRFRGTHAAGGALDAVHEYWNRTLGAVQVETPDPALNVLANGWLLYQIIACRLWARSGYYQSGGAFGFRDQLQDVMALVHAEPQLARTQLLLCASRQFVQGDVQHWWHPPSGRGVRTHCSDDYLWLPLATCRYVLTTGDTGVLDEPIAFLDGRPVNPEDDSYYDLPGRAGVTASLYQHCVRAIELGLRFGEHGLPLMGGGDWNDGMNRVGKDGKGESVWLAFFLHDVLRKFAVLARLRGDAAFAERCRREGSTLRRHIEQHGWDGAWYRRAYFDDGTPLGSAGNAECQIDSISQSWSVLSGGGKYERARTAMNSLDRRLVRREHALIQLLDPPFDKSDADPGYIKGYVPGVRENGGQYTHAAIWAAMAFAELGDSERAWELLRMINPVNHGNTSQAVATYKVEPYVAAADVYAVAPHTGRGGWTWYTGSAGWLYRLIVESLLGLRLEADKLHFAPCLPMDWTTFTVHYRYRETVYHIVLGATPEVNGEGRVTVDGVDQHDLVIPLIDDRGEHTVEVTCARRPTEPIRA